VNDFKAWMWAATYLFEAAGIVVIIGGFVFGAWRGVMLLLKRDACAAYDTVRADLGRGVLLGLEILVAADLIRTVAVELTLLNVGVLAALVGIRTFLSWSLEAEIEGQWPWQKGVSVQAKRVSET